jgi:hypothetical protein
VQVTVVNAPADGPSTRTCRLTDADGNFTCRPDTELDANGKLYSIEIDVDAYFISMGIVPGYKQAAFLARIDQVETDYLLEAFITPFGLAIWSVN